MANDSSRLEIYQNAVRKLIAVDQYRYWFYNEKLTVVDGQQYLATRWPKYVLKLLQAHSTPKKTLKRDK